MPHSKTVMASIALALVSIGSVSATAQPDNARNRTLLKLELGTRMEQRCDARAGGEVARHHPGFKPDKVIAYAFSDPKKHGTEIVAPGAVIRNSGHWYRLSFRCKTSDDGLEIVSFDHTLGPEIPGWDMSQLYHGD